MSAAAGRRGRCRRAVSANRRRRGRQHRPWRRRANLSSSGARPRRRRRPARSPRGAPAPRLPLVGPGRAAISARSPAALVQRRRARGARPCISLELARAARRGRAVASASFVQSSVRSHAMAQRESRERVAASRRRGHYNVVRASVRSIMTPSRSYEAPAKRRSPVQFLTPLSAPAHRALERVLRRRRCVTPARGRPDGRSPPTRARQTGEQVPPLPRPASTSATAGPCRRTALSTESDAMPMAHAGVHHPRRSRRRRACPCQESPATSSTPAREPPRRSRTRRPLPARADYRPRRATRRGTPPARRRPGARASPAAWPAAPPRPRTWPRRRTARRGRRPAGSARR